MISIKRGTVVKARLSTLSFVLLSLQVPIFLIYSFMLWTILTYQPTITCFCRLIHSIIIRHLPPLFVVDWLLFAGCLVSALTIAAAVWNIRTPVKTTILGRAFAGIVIGFVLMLLYDLSVFDYMWLLPQLNMYEFVIRTSVFVSIVTVSAVALDRLLRHVERRFATGSTAAARRETASSISAFNSIVFVASATLPIAVFILYLMWSFINPSVWFLKGNTFTQMQPWLAFVLLVIVILISCATMSAAVWLNLSNREAHDSE